MEQVRDALTEAIVNGDIAPNQPLSERDLSIELGVSRTPVREALYALERLGFVTRKTRVGWRVAVPDIDSVREIFELRELIESAGVEKAVTLPDNALERLVTLFDSFSEDDITGRVHEYLERDKEFHNRIVLATDNSRIITIYEQVALHIDWFRHIVSYRIQERIRQSFNEHREIGNALAARDAVKARDLLFDHLSHVKSEFLSLMEYLRQ